MYLIFIILAWVRAATLVGFLIGLYHILTYCIHCNSTIYPLSTYNCVCSELYNDTNYRFNYQGPKGHDLNGTIGQKLSDS